MLCGWCHFIFDVDKNFNCFHGYNEMKEWNLNNKKYPLFLPEFDLKLYGNLIIEAYAAPDVTKHNVRTVVFFLFLSPRASVSGERALWPVAK